MKAAGTATAELIEPPMKQVSNECKLQVRAIKMCGWQFLVPGTTFIRVTSVFHQYHCCPARLCKLFCVIDGYLS